MNKLIFFLSLLICINGIFCSEVQMKNGSTTNDDIAKPKNTLSIIFKLMYRNEPCITKKPKHFYESYLNNFNQHTQSLRDTIKSQQTNPDDIHGLRSKIVTEDLMPLRHKIKNILRYVKNNNVSLANPTQTINKTKHSPRIQIIDSMITIFKDNTFALHHKTIKDFQYIINYIAQLSTEKSHNTKAKNQILTTLLEISLNNETLNKKTLKNCKKILIFPQKKIIDDYPSSTDTNTTTENTEKSS